MKSSKRTHMTRLVAVVLTAALAVGAAPAMASVLVDARAASISAKFASVLVPVDVPVTRAEKIAAPEADVAFFTQASKRPAKAKAPLPKPVVAKSATRSTSTRTSGTSTASRPASGSATQASAPAAQASSGDKLAQARSILANRARTWKYVSGTTVEFGDTRGNPQAIVYYKSKRIIINPNHTASLERIIDHEIWHIIDWHHNGQINWGEAVPPSNAGDFRL